MFESSRKHKHAERRWQTKLGVQFWIYRYWGAAVIMLLFLFWNEASKKKKGERKHQCCLGGEMKMKGVKKINFIDIIRGSKCSCACLSEECWMKSLYLNEIFHTSNGREEVRLPPSDTELVNMWHHPNVWWRGSLMNGDKTMWQWFWCLTLTYSLSLSFLCCCKPHTPNVDLGLSLVKNDENENTLVVVIAN